MKKQIVITLQVEGIHNWPTCDIEGVEFLKYPHRHIFHIKAKKEVSHNDRDIEIIKLKREITEYLNCEFGINDKGIKYYSYCNFESRSCEDIAQQLLTVFRLNYCSVLEDNENGAEVFI